MKKTAQPIAIIGLAFRLPGAETLDALWPILAKGRSMIKELPQARRGAGFPEDQQFWGGFVDDADGFEPEFFGISPREAQSMDPQQRFVLELAWNAIEDAGLRPDALAGPRTGVFMGACHWDYLEMMGRSGAAPDAYMPTGIATSILSNRVSFQFDLNGPSVTNDTACSSALVAVYQAVQALRDGTCDTALAGAANLIWSPDHFRAFNRNGMLSKTGQSRAFDKAANGYVRGEGAVVVLLKPLAQAEAAGDPIHAVLHGVGINHGGRSSGLTVTNPAAQADLIHAVLSGAGIAPADLDYIEAHGTGTPLGDPIEVAGLKRALGRLYEETGKPPEPGRTVIGSVKTNIGHLEGAAGLAGITKIICAFRHNAIPPNAGFETANPLLRLDGAPLRIADRLQPWTGSPRAAAVSSFGFGGTNAHAVLTDHAVRRKFRRAKGPHIIVMSARDMRGLRARATGLAAFLTTHPKTNLRALAWTLQTGRVAMDARLSIVCKDITALRTALDGFVASEKAASVFFATVQAETAQMPVKLAKWVKKGAFAKIARAWVEGADVDWTLLGKPAPRLHLPGYVFDRARHWFPVVVPEVTFEVENRSTLRDGRFHLRLAVDHPFLRDHIINGIAILPGTAILEVVRAASAQYLDHTGPLELRSVVWLRSVAAGADGAEPDQVALNIALVAEDGGASFRVEDAKGVLCAKGHVHLALLSEPAIRPDVAGVPGSVAASYERLCAAGIVHGPAFQALESITASDKCVFAELDLPKQAGKSADCAGHPILLDAAIQAISALPGTAPLGIPFAVDSVTFAAPVTTRMRTRVVDLGGARFDLDLWRDDGDIAVQIRGLTTRILSGAAAKPDNRLTLATPVWEADSVPSTTATPFDFIAVGVTTPSSAACDGLIAVGLPAQAVMIDGATPADTALNVSLTLLTLLQSLARERRPARGLVILPTDDALARAISPLLHTVALEHPLLTLRLVETDVADLVPLVAREAGLTGAEDVRITSDGVRHLRRFVPVLQDPTVGGRPWREGGVYWITGGTGALGRILARHLIAQGAGVVVLSSRSVPVDPVPEGAVFLPCDMKDVDAIHATRAQIEAEFGPLRGVVHAAGLLRDGLAAGKKPADFGAVFGPKAAGLIALDSATAQCSLDFFAVFSSIAAVHGAVGQVDYASANGFLDGWMQARRNMVAGGRRQGRNLVINWPLWSDGGMTVPPRVLAAMSDRMGVVPMPSDVGLALFDQMVAGVLPEHIAAGFGGGSKISRFLMQGDRRGSPITAIPAQAQAERALSQQNAAALNVSKTAVLDKLRAMFGLVLAIAPDRIRADTPFDTYGFDSIIAVEMIEQLERWLTVDLPRTLFFEHVDLNGIADYLLSDHNTALSTVLTPQLTQPQPVPPPSETATATSKPVAPNVHTDRSTRDIAVIGIGGRYPGADDLDGFWDILRNGQHAFRPVPQDRWPHEEIYFPERSVLGKSTIQTGSFLDGIDQFDPRYFNISQGDAEMMSPEVRLLLESAVQTFEDAGYSRETLQSKMAGDVGVLVGTMSNHYNLFGMQNMLTRGARASGSYTGTMPNMISYFYGLTGPSLFVDTMCSASLTALDLAVRLLREGQCKMALAGGVNLLLHPFNLISSSQEHFTSNRAEVIRSFGQGADGTILGEGVGTALLKPLRDAERDGDNIQAVIRGTAMTNAGVRNGFTVPRPGMQAKAVRDALSDAGVVASTISYIETHGSGTKLGDPIEISALHEVFGRSGTCKIGSVKSNVAHLLAAAGIVGFTKVLLQMRHGQIAPSLHSDTLNPSIPFDKSPFVVQQRLTPWDRPVGSDGVELPRRAGLTSIGAGGMNAHMIIEEYVYPVRATMQPVPRPIVISGMNPTGLGDVITRYLGWIDTHPDTDYDALAYTLAVGRTALRCRLACVATDLGDLAGKLRSYLAGHIGDWTYTEDVLALSDRQSDVRGDDAAAICAIWAVGQPVDWDKVWGAAPPTRISLPSYPFQRVRCWVDVFDDAPTLLRPEAFRRRLHPFLGSNTSDLSGIRYTTTLRVDDLLDYARREAGTQILQSMALLDAAMAAVETLEFRIGKLLDINWYCHDLSVLDEVIFQVHPDVDDLVVDVKGDDAFIFSARFGRAGPVCQVLPAPIPMGTEQKISCDILTEILLEKKIEFAPYGTVLKSFSCNLLGESDSEIAQPTLIQDHARRNVILPPEVLSAIVQVIQFTARQFGHAGWASFQPKRVEEMILVPDFGAVVTLRAALECKGDRLTGQIQLFDSAGVLIGFLSGVQAKAADEGNIVEHDGADSLLTLRTLVADLQKFDLADVDTQTSFHALGFDSIGLAALTDAVNTRFGVQLTPAVFYDVETIAALAHSLGPARAMQVSGRPQIKAPKATVRPVRGPAMRQPIAIVGMAGNFPGASNLDEYSRMLQDGRSALTQLQMDRYSTAYADRMRAAALPPEGGFLRDIKGFDADFFQVSRTEAEVTDPQHRLMLECIWQVLENAARPPAGLSVQTGVFLGVSGQDYKELMQAEGVAPSGYMSTGTSHAMLANRVSHLLNLQGPSEALDTACSSALVAVHRAVGAIRAGECAMALAGGVNIALSLEPFAGPLGAGMLSPTAQCHTFAAQADGYVRGEGVGAVLLRPLDDALRDGDVIHGVIVGSAQNHGGRSSSLTAPRTNAQAALVEAAMTGIDPASVQYIEAHGTGTPLGDPVEVNALKRAYGNLAKARGVDLVPGSIALGSVKTNIGHLEAAAGIAGLIKVLLALRAEQIPATLGATPRNPFLELDGSPFCIADTATPWRGPNRRGAVSSFGFGGANAHVVIEAPPDPVAPVGTDTPQVIVLSARTATGLTQRIANLSVGLPIEAVVDGVGLLEQIAWTLQSGREPMAHRLAFVAVSLTALRAQLAAVLAGDDAGVWRGVVRHGGVFARDRGRDLSAVKQDSDPRDIAQDWVGGADLDWANLHAGRIQRIALPGYPFEHQDYWFQQPKPTVAPVARTRANPPATRAVMDVLDDLIEGRTDVARASRTLTIEGSEP